MAFKFPVILATLMILLLAGASATSVVSYYFDTSSSNDTTITSSEVIYSSSVSFQVNTNKPTNCKYSEIKGIPYAAMPEVFDFNFETLHKKTMTELSDGVHKYYVKCRDDLGNESKELEAIFAVSSPVSAQIVLPDNSPLRAGRIEIKLITSKIVSQTPSLSYSFDGISYNPLPISGSGTSWTGYLIIPNSIEEEVGSFKFQGRDIEGVQGTEITSGGIFLVDTLKPKTISDIKATGYEGKIDLTWHLDNTEEINKFNIYRSTTPNLDYSDYYETSEGDSFSDTNVEKGKTYYYRVSAVDEAGNEGDLSLEVYATVLLENTIISPSGLEARFLGIVDNFLSEIDSLDESAKNAKENLEEKSGKEKEIYSDLKLGREIDGAVLELSSLRKEIENYKSQSLTKEELDKKLNSGKLKLNTIKRKIPETIIINSEKTESGEIEENDILQAIMQLNPEITQRDIDKMLENSFKSIEENNFKIKRLGYNLEISYLDGTRKELSFIKEELESELEKNENISILEIIPKSIVDSVSNVYIKNVNYDVLKEDSIISFDTDTKEIIYSIEEKVDLNSLKEIKTILMHKAVEKEKPTIFTGYLALSNFSTPGNSIVIFIGIILATSMLSYFVIIRKKRGIIEKISPAREQILEAEERIKDGRIEMAKEMYDALSKEYKKMGKGEKKEIYNELENLHKKLNEVLKK